MAANGMIEGLPVIVISAMNEMESIVRAIELGAEDFLLKPFDPTLLRARVLATLEKKQLRDHMREELARKQTELAEARSLQLALVPDPYNDEFLTIDLVLEPAREIGGDLVDHVPLSDAKHVLVVGDVSDKGAGRGPGHGAHPCFAARPGHTPRCPGLARRSRQRRADAEHRTGDQ